MIRPTLYPVPRPSLAAISLVVSLAGIGWSLSTPSVRAAGAPSPKSSASGYGSQRVPFVENQGQLATNVRYYAYTRDGAMYVTDKGELVYAVKSGGKDVPAGWALKETINTTAELTPEGRGVAKRKARLPAAYRDVPKGAPMRQAVRLGEAYPGVVIEVKAYRTRVGKTLVLSPDAKPEAIDIGVSGAQRLLVNKRGELVLETEIGSVRLARPIAYQLRNGRKEPVKVAYRVGENRYGFRVGTYDSSRPLVID